MLDRIKRAQRNEKIYNVALKKLKRKHYRKDYQSDSCLPIETDPFNDFSDLPRRIVNRRQVSQPKRYVYVRGH